MKRFIVFFIIISSFLFLKVNAKGYGVGSINNNERPNTYIKEIALNNGYTIGADSKDIYLTFDCGYENGYTLQILNTLKENEVPACFFITGHYLDSSKDIVKRMIDDKHLIGNHTLTHKSFPNISNDEIIKEIKAMETKYYKEFGLKLSYFVRPPKGEYDARSMKLLNDNGYKTIFWSLAYVDWYKDKYNGNHYSYNQVMKKIHNGAIILMHTVSKDNACDLDDIIKELKNKGYTFKSLYDLCNI